MKNNRTKMVYLRDGNIIHLSELSPGVTRIKSMQRIGEDDYTCLSFVDYKVDLTEMEDSLSDLMYNGEGRLVDITILFELAEKNSMNVTRQIFDSLFIVDNVNEFLKEFFIVSNNAFFQNSVKAETAISIFKKYIDTSNVKNALKGLEDNKVCENILKDMQLKMPRFSMTPMNGGYKVIRFE